MKPAFALDFQNETISLLHRSGSGWQIVGSVPLDTPDLPEALGYLRATALGLSPRGLATKLIIPNDQILYTSVYAPGPDAESRHAQVMAALEGRTPYDVADLAFDYHGDGPEVQVAVIAKETLAEAEGFAAEHRFNPLAFVAAPEDHQYRGEPWFGTSALAASLLSPGDTVERDAGPVTAQPRGFPVEPAPEAPPTPEYEPEPEPLPEPEPISEPVPVPEPSYVPEPEDQPTPQEQPAPEDLPEPEYLPEPSAPEIVPEPELLPEPDPVEVPAEEPGWDAPAEFPQELPQMQSAAAWRADVQDDDRDLIAALADTLAEPMVQPEPAPMPPAVVLPEVDEAPMALDVADENPVEDEPQGVGAIKAALAAQTARVISPTIEDDLPPPPSAAALMAFSSRRQGDEPAGKAPALGAAKGTASRPAVAKPLAAAAERAAVARPAAARPEPVAKPAKPGKSALRGLGALVSPAAASVEKPRSKVSIPSALQPLKPADPATAAPARPAAARPPGGFAARPPVRGKPRYLGLVLTTVLLFLLAMIAAWSSYSLGAWNFGEEPVQTVVEDPAAPDSGAAVPDAADEMAADLQDPAGLEEAAVPVADSAAATAETAPQTNIATEAAVPPNPTSVTQDEIFLASMDAPPVAPDPLTLPAPDARGDPLPAAQPAPPPFGTVYQFEPNGTIVPTPEGIITPEGVLLLAGKPARVPTVRPETVIAAAAAANPAVVPAVAPAAVAPEAAAVFADPSLAGKKPKARPEGLKPVVEDQGSLAPEPSSRVASLRPLARPANIASAGKQAQEASANASLAAQAEAAVQEATLLAPDSKMAVVISRKPAPRPRDLSRAVEAAVAAASRQPEPEPEPVAKAQPKAAAPAAPEDDGEPEVASAAPKIPTKATVAKQATFKNAINLSKINLIGVYGSKSNRYALVRTPAGRYKKVRVGDSLDGGGKVQAITASEVRYQKGGRLVTLAMPKG